MTFSTAGTVFCEGCPARVVRREKLHDGDESAIVERLVDAGWTVDRAPGRAADHYCPACTRLREARRLATSRRRTARF